MENKGSEMSKRDQSRDQKSPIFPIINGVPRPLQKSEPKTKKIKIKLECSLTAPVLNKAIQMEEDL